MPVAFEVVDLPSVQRLNAEKPARRANRSSRSIRNTVRQPILTREQPVSPQTTSTAYYVPGSTNLAPAHADFSRFADVTTFMSFVPTCKTGYGCHFADLAPVARNIWPILGAAGINTGRSRSARIAGRSGAAAR
jgi:hypothetical protein